jgi:hypothetical protein
MLRNGHLKAGVMLRNGHLKAGDAVVIPCRSAQGAWGAAEREVCQHATSRASASTAQRQAQCCPAWRSSVVGVQLSPWWPGEHFRP